MTKSTSQPRARANRFQAGLSATVETGGQSAPCIAINLSRTGALLVGEFPAPTATEVQLGLASATGDLRLSLGARVIRCEANEEETRLAVEFVRVHPDDRATLEALVARVVEGGTPAALEGLSENATTQQIRAALEKVALPHRIQLAIRALPKERALLMHDPHPQVIDAIARNPHLLQQEVLALLRMPTILPHTIETLAKDTRWMGSQQITVRIATHRNTPLALADQLVAQMPISALQKVIQSSGLRAALREKVLKRLPRR